MSASLPCLPAASLPHCISAFPTCCLPAFLPNCILAYQLPGSLPACKPASLSTWLPACLLVCLPAYIACLLLAACLPVYLISTCSGVQWAWANSTLRQLKDEEFLVNDTSIFHPGRYLEFPLTGQNTWSPSHISALVAKIAVTVWRNA
jgi:hypothetical protein